MDKAFVSRTTLILLSISIIGLGIFGATRTALAPTEHNSQQGQLLDVAIAIEGITPLETRTASRGATALTLLASLAHDRSIILETKVFSGLGTMVQNIGGYENGTDGNYWQYFVNGTLAPVGADTYEILPGDTIEWKFVEPRME